MIYKQLGRSGVKVSVLSFGSWITFGNQIKDQTAEELMILAYESGVNFFDNAETYADGKSETVMGNILHKLKWERSSYLVSSKVFWGGKLPNQFGLSRKHIMEACNASLKRLRVDYLDLYFCHRPDKNTPVEETVRAMSDLIQQGKILYWGTSEWSAAEIMEAYSVARQYHLVPPTMEQPQYNLFTREKFEVEYHRLYHSIGLGTTIWSPLASGLLSGKYSYMTTNINNTRMELQELNWLKEKSIGEISKTKHEKVAALGALAKELAIPLPCLAIAWCLYNPNVSTVILGASRTDQLKQNLQTIEFLPVVNQEVIDKMEQIIGNKPKLPVY